MGVTTSTDRNKRDTVWLTPQQVAKKFGVSVRVVRGWGNNGDIPSLLLPNGRRRYAEDDVDNYYEANYGRARASGTSSSDTSAELPGQERLPV